MSAAAAEVVPNLWERVDGRIQWIDHAGRPSTDGVFLYACWHRDREALRPHVYLTLGSGPFDITLRFLPVQAREFAAQLVRAAELAEATKAALDAEQRAKELEPCFSK